MFKSGHPSLRRGEGAGFCICVIVAEGDCAFCAAPFGRHTQRPPHDRHGPGRPHPQLQSRRGALLHAPVPHPPLGAPPRQAPLPDLRRGALRRGDGGPLHGGGRRVPLPPVPGQAEILKARPTTPRGGGGAAGSWADKSLKIGFSPAPEGFDLGAYYCLPAPEIVGPQGHVEPVPGQAQAPLLLPLPPPRGLDKPGLFLGICVVASACLVVYVKCNYRPGRSPMVPFEGAAASLESSTRFPLLAPERMHLNSFWSMGKRQGWKMCATFWNATGTWPLRGSYPGIFACPEVVFFPLELSRQMLLWQVVYSLAIGFGSLILEPPRGERR